MPASPASPSDRRAAIRFIVCFGLVSLALLIVLGIGVSLLALPLGLLLGPVGAIVGVVLWGAGLGVQDAALRSGIAQVVSMNKRGTAFGIFNGVYGVAWFAGSALMGLVYDRSLVALVLFGVVAQTAAAVMFFRLHRFVRLAPRS